jgi:2-iminobutanoate/2-iminopropanoate deaminase
MSSTKTIISTPDAPPAIGPYSQAVQFGSLLFCSGMLPLDPADPAAAFSADVAEQTQQILKNITALLASQGLKLEQVVKTTVFLTDMADFAAMNAVYSQHFSANPPARSTVAVAGLPRAAKVEIEVIVGL